MASLTIDATVCGVFESPREDNPDPGVSRAMHVETPEREGITVW